MKMRRISSVAVAAIAVTSLAACSSTSESATDTTPAASASGATTGGAIKEGLKIAVLPKAVNIPYFDAAFVGAEKACAEIGATCEQVGPTEATGPAQVQFINTVIQQGYDALVISAADADSVVPALQQASDAGIAVVTYDADVTDKSARSAFVRPTTDELIGKAQVKWISDAIGPDGGEIAILSAAATAANQNNWIKIMEEELANYPQLKLVDTVYGDDDAAKSAEKAAALMQSHPNLKGIISPTTVGVAAAAQYISGSDYKGKVQVTGLGLPSEMAAYVKDGTVQKFGLWDPAMLGYLGVYAAATEASGQELGTTLSVDGTDFPIETDGVITVGPPQEFTAENIDQFKF
jgi:rhamnose transport system substrate-binding protein